MPLDPRRARIARNEASFREINERLEQGLRQVRHVPEPQPFICECGNGDCQATIELTVDEYEAVRLDSRRFAVAPGHVFTDTEHVVEATDRYEVVEKYAEATPITDETDRRAPGSNGLREEPFGS